MITLLFIIAAGLFVASTIYAAAVLISINNEIKFSQCTEDGQVADEFAFGCEDRSDANDIHNKKIKP